ncbi:hypothetical protein F5Y14DRAFT_30433 [Nemania sp. NC0429]|nr:hypothetical protein F5Y14DRAFT_30433 [Nemania sp. NC0429]
MVSSTQLFLSSACLCLISLASSVAGLPPQHDKKTLNSRQAPYQARIFETGTTFLQENNGAWQLIDANGDGVPDLAYIKTTATASRYVEVQIASSSSNFQARIFAGASTFYGGGNNGTWLLVPSGSSLLPDLALIKTRNTPSGRVEVHIASGASSYRTQTLATTTVFRNENNGAWTLYDYDGDGVLDLVYIKTSNTASGRVEVQAASGALGYSQLTLLTPTTFLPENDGFWSLAPYSSPGAADLVYIRDINSATGQVEVHVASKSSGYQARPLEAGSSFLLEADGVWSLVDYNRDGRPDLIYIRTRNAATGTVEVHVAAG